MHNRTFQIHTNFKLSFGGVVMEQVQESSESTVDFADIPHYLVEQIPDLEQVIEQDTGKSVMLYQQPNANSY